MLPDSFICPRETPLSLKPGSPLSYTFNEIDFVFLHLPMHEDARGVVRVQPAGVTHADRPIGHVSRLTRNFIE